MSQHKSQVLFCNGDDTIGKLHEFMGDTLIAGCRHQHQHPEILRGANGFRKVTVSRKEHCGVVHRTLRQSHHVQRNQRVNTFPLAYRAELPAAVKGVEQSLRFQPYVICGLPQRTADQGFDGIGVLGNVSRAKLDALGTGDGVEQTPLTRVIMVV